jgi:hypothetical protein
VANDELRRVPPGKADTSWLSSVEFGNMGGNAGITSRPFIRDGGIYLFLGTVLHTLKQVLLANSVFHYVEFWQVCCKKSKEVSRYLQGPADQRSKIVRRIYEII